jgi:hypothetical protein
MESILIGLVGTNLAGSEIGTVAIAIETTLYMFTRKRIIESNIEPVW